MNESIKWAQHNDALTRHARALLRVYVGTLSLRSGGDVAANYGEIFYEDLTSLGISEAAVLMRAAGLFFGTDLMQRKISYGPFELTPVDGMLHRNDIDLKTHLTDSESRLFSLAMINGGRVVTHSRFKDELVDRRSGSCKTFISRIRDKIEDEKLPNGNFRFWQTIRGVGYRLVG